VGIPLNLLLIEDSIADAELVVHELGRHGYDLAVERVSSAEALAAALPARAWDLAISDHALPGLDSAQALEIIRQVSPGLPFIILSGAIPEAAAVAAMKAGARDVVSKGNLSRLGPVVDRELQEASTRHLQREGADALLATEARTRAIFDSALDGVIAIDETGAVVEFNPAAEAMFGHPRSEIIGREMAGLLLPPTERDAHRRGLAHFLATGEGPILGRRLELTGLRRDGSEFPIELSVAHTRVRGASLFTGTVRDLTEQRRLELQLRQAQRLESVGRLAGGIAHDFNNVLTAIIGFTDLIADDLEPGNPSRPNVDEIRSAAHRAEKLVGQLLAFSRQQILRVELVDPADIVRRLAPMLNRLIGEDVEFSLPRPTDLWSIEVDPGQLEQVIVNLAVNARDAMPLGGRLTIETANVELDSGYASSHPDVTPGPHVMLAVSDTGVGMDPGTQAQIFEPFFTTKEAGRGTGLGLATVFGIVKQSGGHIWVYSEAAEGTTFRLYFPRAARRAEAPAAEPRTRPSASRGTETILVAEDESVLRDLIRIVLERLGYRVLVATDAASAIELFGSERVDLVLTDVVMPGLSGPDLAEAIRMRAPTIRVLYMSGYTVGALERHGQIAREALLEKPFTPQSLGQAVRWALDR
jgi:two-component system cell cycle sensor histidine kinase/response regulator CckA